MNYKEQIKKENIKNYYNKLVYTTCKKNIDYY